MRQRPATASGVVFIALEDETGIASLIVRPKIYERFRQAAKHGVVPASGKIERPDNRLISLCEQDCSLPLKSQATQFTTLVLD